MTEVLERGNVFFFYRPRVEEEDPESLKDVQRMYMVLDPRGRKKMRRMVIGQKKLPAIKNGGGKTWGFVEDVTTAKRTKEELGAEEYETKTRGERRQPAARPAGEGVYAIARHDDHTHFAYALEMPEKPKKVQKALNIDDEGSYVVSVKNPEKPAPAGAGLGEHQQADLPKKLMERFRDRRFADVDPTAFLDHEGVEVLFVGAHEETDELGIKLDPKDEDEESSELLRKLRLPQDEAPREPLTEGKWE